MELENLITEAPKTDVTEKRDRLVAVAHGGLAEELLGKRLTAEKIRSMKPEEIEGLYTTYEICLGASMTKSLGSAAISLYARGAAAFFLIDEKKLTNDLEIDPFLNTALRSASCELFHRWGAWFAPFSVVLITGRHIKQSKHNTYSNDNDKKSEESGGREEISRAEGAD